MGVDKRGNPGVRCSCNIVGVGMGRSTRPDGEQGEPVLTVLVKDRAEAERMAASCPAISTAKKSRGVEILEVGNVVALTK